MISTALVVLSLTTGSFASYIGAGYGLGYGVSHFGVSRGIGYSTVTGFAHSIGYAPTQGYSLIPAGTAHAPAVPLLTAHAVPALAPVVVPAGVATVTTTYHAPATITTLTTVPATVTKVTTTYHTPAVSTDVHLAPVYGHKIGSLGYGTGNYGFGYGLGAYGLNYGYGLGTPVQYLILLRRRK